MFETEAGLSLHQSALSAIDPQKRKAHLEALTGGISDLPALSTVGMSLMQELMNPHTTVKKLSEIINAEPVVAAKVLCHANSSFYGLSNKIQTVHHAITMLGIEAIKEIAFNLYFYSLTQGGADESSEFFERYLKRCLTTAVLCKKICGHYGFQSVGGGEAYLAGLLQNIGIFLLFRVKRKKYLEAIPLREIEQIPLYEAEERIFGCNHADIGGWLAEQWNLPPGLREVIQQHHRPCGEILNQELLAILQLSDVIADHMGVTLGKSQPPLVLSQISLDTLNKRIPFSSREELIHQAVSTFGSICLVAGDLVRSLEGKDTDAPVQQQPAQPALPKATPVKPTPVVKQSSEPPHLIFVLLICGLGQMLRGEIGRGMLLFLSFSFCLTIFFLTVGHSSAIALLCLTGGAVIWWFSVRDTLHYQRERS